MLGQQIPGGAEPGEKRGNGREIEVRQNTASAANAQMTRVWNRNMRMRQGRPVEMAQVQMGQMQAAGRERQEAQPDADEKADQIKSRPRHGFAPAVFLRFGCRSSSGFSTSLNRSSN